MIGVLCKVTCLLFDQKSTKTKNAPMEKGSALVFLEHPRTLAPLNISERKAYCPLGQLFFHFPNGDGISELWFSHMPSMLPAGIKESQKRQKEQKSNSDAFAAGSHLAFHLHAFPRVHAAAVGIESLTLPSGACRAAQDPSKRHTWVTGNMAINSVP